MLSYILLLALVASGQELGMSNAKLCICKCCYMGDCAPLANASWRVDSCVECSARHCQTLVRSSAAKQKMARFFETLQDHVPDGARAGITVDTCEVISVLEAATCTSPICKSTTLLKATCFDRNDYLHKYIVWTFVLVSGFAVAFGFVKNYLPALQEFNYKYFNY